MTTWTPTTKHSSSYSNQTKNSSSFSNQAKSLSGGSFLLLESGFYLLLEDNVSKIMLEQSTSGATTWSNLTKN